MKGALSTHVLDTASGKPAAGVRVYVFRGDEFVAKAVTNADGRTDGPLVAGDAFTVGSYTIEFGVGQYYIDVQHPDARRFLDRVRIDFLVDDPAAGYHVPLLCSPWSYSTYRGS